MRLNWQTHGGHGPHLLLVHGFLSSAAQWQCNLEGLQAHFQPVTVELLGHGRSCSPTDDEPYHPDAYLAQFELIREALGARSWFVLGYSMGAGLTIRYALAHPDRLLGQLFTNSTSAFADDSQQKKMRGYAQKYGPRLLADGPSALEGLAVHPKRAMSLPAQIKTALVADAERLSPVGITQTLTHTIPALSVRSLVHHNQVNALMLWGQKERRFKEYAEFAIATMPKLQVATLSTGHGVNMEQPDVFNAHVTNFKQLCLTSSTN